MSEELAGSRWLRRTSIDGGWVVLCRLCGKPSKRSFLASITNYAEAERSSRAYAHEHIATAGHQAAMQAYQRNDAQPDRNEVLLSEIFGTPVPSGEELRRRKARTAARVAENRERRERERERSRVAVATQVLCAICEKPVSVRPEREEDRLELPSGALVHAWCVSRPSP